MEYDNVQRVFSMSVRSQTEAETRIRQLVDQSFASRLFPGLEILAAKGDSIRYHQIFGRFEGTPQSPKLERNSLFDLASLTKPLATTSAILHLVESDLLDLEERVSILIPEFRRQGTEKITVRHLLTHTSGLPAWSALYEPEFDKTSGWDKLFNTELQSPPETEMVYSCLGFILLGEIVRRVSKLSLSEYCREFIFSPLGLRNPVFNHDQSRQDLVPTAYCPFRKKMLRGIVHDENAYLFDGEGGNAGLFGTATDIFRFCRMLLCGGVLNNVRIFTPETTRLMFRNHNPVPISARALGWDYNASTAKYMSCGDRMPRGSVGHLGFTGTSLWLDPDSKIVVIILSNRVYFSREKSIPLMQSFRPKMHGLILSGILERENGP